MAISPMVACFVTPRPSLLTTRQLLKPSDRARLLCEKLIFYSAKEDENKFAVCRRPTLKTKVVATE